MLCLVLVCTAVLASSGEEIRVRSSIPAPSLTPDWISLDRWLESQCKEHGIPGLALVVIRGNEVVHEKLLGHSDADLENAVTRDTVFPIGSCAKPFTSTLAAMLVSDGVIAWDDPVTDHLPYFELKIRSDDENAQVTLRDLLSHRTGFFTMELIQDAVNWAQDPDYDKKYPSGRYSRKELLLKAVALEPQAGFREKHLYSNISMLAAGMACGAATGFTWDEVMKARMFEPLGMKRTTTSITDIGKADTVATGYLFDGKKRERALLIDMDVIAPAGGVNSTLADMTRWLKFLLAEGKLDGTRHVDAPALRETWTSQVEGADVGGMFPRAEYGLGWFIRSWKDHKVVEHGGNALGYSALVAMIPGKRVGFVMLSNLLPNPLQATLGERIWPLLIPENENSPSEESNP